jgi:hypothetical protein
LYAFIFVCSAWDYNRISKKTKKIEKPKVSFRQDFGSFKRHLLKTGFGGRRFKGKVSLFTLQRSHWRQEQRERKKQEEMKNSLDVR